MTRFLLILASLLFLQLNAQPQAQELLIDNFDASNVLQRWRFSNGAQLRDASGTLSLGPGHEGRGAVLKYRFTCLDQTHCGRYVAAIWKARFPVEVEPGASLSLWVRLSPDVRLVVRVTDQTSQTLQFEANAPTLEHQSQSEWQPIILPIASKAAWYWGGANGRQGRVVEIAIMADARYARPAQGQIVFDDVRLLRKADASFRLDPAAAVIPPPEGAGQLRPRLGVNIHFLNDDRALDLARDAGFSFVREDLPWAKLEKQGQYDFRPFDDLMRSLEARGMGVLWLLDYGHPDHGGKAPHTPGDFAAYARYAAAVVSHFSGRNARFEIWNEPNLKQFLPSPAIYPELFRAALNAIRREHPAAAVSTGGVSGFDFPFFARTLGSVSARKASAIGLHPYRNSGPETLVPDLMLLRQLIQRSIGHNAPVWITEWGYPSYGYFRKDFPGDGHNDVARKRQAVFAARECLTVWALGLPLAVWYDLRDDGSDPLNQENNFGLLNQENSSKPAMRAVRALTRIARDHKYAGLVGSVPYGIHAMRLNGAEDTVFALWNEQADAPTEIRFPRSEWISASNLFGEPLQAERARRDELALTLKETMGPIYVRLKRRKDRADLQ